VQREKRKHYAELERAEREYWEERDRYDSRYDDSYYDDGYYEPGFDWKRDWPLLLVPFMNS
jgi:hypothetical protein